MIKKPNILSVERFLKERTEPDTDSTISAADLFALWKDWCRDNDVWSRTPTWFGSTLTYLDQVRHYSGQKLFYVGLKPKEQAEAEDVA